MTLLVRKDYQRAGIPMLPVVYGEDETRWQIFLYSVLLVGITLLPFAVREVGLFYLIAALLLGGWLVVLSIQLMRDKSKRTARRLYKYSSLYLALIFLAMVIDRMGVFPLLN